MLEDINNYPSHFTKLSSEVFPGVGCHAASHIQRSTPLKIGPIDLPETSVTNYESTLHDLLERRSHLHHGGSCKSRVLNGALRPFTLPRIENSVISLQVEVSSQGSCPVRPQCKNVSLGVVWRTRGEKYCPQGQCSLLPLRCECTFFSSGGCWEILSTRPV
jgi:hypothetical protein